MGTDPTFPHETCVMHYTNMYVYLSRAIRTQKKERKNLKRITF